MTTVTTTEWLDGKTKPVHEGVYRTSPWKHGGGWGYAYWGDGRWQPFNGWGNHYRLQPFYWQGLTGPTMAQTWVIE